ncbi:MAG: DNA binding protein VP5 [Chaetfec virus UA24_2340]|nr:MAG: DNA binding protein VP5 [Chaetfec virus UA24_2340]
MLFSILDTKTKLYGPLFEAETVDGARRVIFQTLLRDDTSNLSMFPDDFTLCSLGDFSHDTGLLSPSVVTTECVISDISKEVKKYIELKRFEFMKGDSKDDDIVEASSDTESSLCD